MKLLKCWAFPAPTVWKNMQKRYFLKTTWFHFNLLMSIFSCRETGCWNQAIFMPFRLMLRKLMMHLLHWILQSKPLNMLASWRWLFEISPHLLKLIHTQIHTMSDSATFVNYCKNEYDKSFSVSSHFIILSSDQSWSDLPPLWRYIAIFASGSVPKARIVLNRSPSRTNKKFRDKEIYCNFRKVNAAYNKLYRFVVQFRFQFLVVGNLANSFHKIFFDDEISFGSDSEKASFGAHVTQIGTVETVR